MADIVLVAHNLRSIHNVGSLFRTAEGLGAKKIILTGYTPYPAITNPSSKDSRLPHIAQKIQKQINKTSLGADKYLKWENCSDLIVTIGNLRKEGFTIVGLEQSDLSVSISDYSCPNYVALIVGNEITGLEPSEIQLCDDVIDIPMKGKKESFNVVQAAAMAMFYFTSICKK